MRHLQNSLTERLQARSPFLRTVEGDIAPVNSEHSLPDKSFRVADGKHLPEDRHNVGAHCCHKIGDCGEVRRTVSRKRYEKNFLLAHLSNVVVLGDRFSYNLGTL